MTEPPTRPGALFIRPWFWLLLVGGLFSIPLIKGLGAELPEPLPGLDTEPIDFTLPTEAGDEVALSDLAGHVVVLTELPLANAVESETTLGGIRALRKRLRGLGSSVVFIVLCHGGTADELGALLDARTARKPVNVFLLDEDHDTMDWLRSRGGSASADFFLADRHARIRGVYGMSDIDERLDEAERTRLEAANVAELDRLVADAGMLANWMESDPAPVDS